MKRWATGHELLETHYQGDKDKFFKAIEHGELVPYYGDHEALTLSRLATRISGKPPDPNSEGLRVVPSEVLYHPVAEEGPEGEEEYMELLSGPPSVMWRGVTLSFKEQEKLLNACYLKELSDNGAGPEIPKEKPIKTKKAIADYMKKHMDGLCSEQAIRNWMKEKPPLPYKKEANGHVSVIPSEADEWWKKRKAKKKKTLK
ncbi:MAG: hypothetical protein Q8L09_01990 [Candidatus Moranbacteria bacterium]|nr:hypothetical protein [Candidatus Moranbacteria bacterium]